MKGRGVTSPIVTEKMAMPVPTENNKGIMKSTLLHRIKTDGCTGPHYANHEKMISHKLDEFMSNDPEHCSQKIDEFNQSLRREIYLVQSEERRPPASNYRISAGIVPEDEVSIETKTVKPRPQDVVDFMFQKQQQNRESFRKEREEARNKAKCQRLKTYTPPESTYKPPIQKYHRDRPYFQEYIRYRNDLKPVVMPTFTHAKGSIRDKAKSSYMPKKDRNAISKREKILEDNKRRIKQEEFEAEKIKQFVRSKKLQDARRRQQEQQEMQFNTLTSPIRASTASSIHSPRLSACTFSPPARENYPTAGKFWLTDI